ncbi:hypothetical protein MIND_01032500 [Mycena indigotica]|uniref:Uncharacterized protein n=1 Tax=Mycena indigotica TaxID=2126181 RepID=A0A8H6VV09_9AGAR|nr:uncharacterized protein MIND_01032500 [Mycena indigotica]KAF7294944.1 hypothetical protein MIND_01032500 [Mycena indigotica]
MHKHSPSPLQKRLSVLVQPFDTPSPISPLIEELTPSPLQHSPEPLSPQDPRHELTPPRINSSRRQSLFHSEPRRQRPKSYGGALTVEALELVLDFESRIAEMEARHAQVCSELEEARDALNNERAVRRSSHRFSTLSHARFSSTSSSPSEGQGEAVNDVEYERQLRTELQSTLKKIRAQNETLSRSLHEQEDTCSSLTASLEEERGGRKAAEEEVLRLSSLNLTLFEHNKLLAGRDAALQQDLSELMTKAQAEEYMRTALEVELARRTAVSPLVEETAQDELFLAREELQITTEQLSIVQEECTTLRQRVALLQEQLVMCVDSSSQALEFERELRSDMEERSRLLSDENTSLKTRLDSLEEAFPDGHAPDAWIKRSPPKRRPVSLRLDKKIISPLKLDTTDRIVERYRHVATSKRVREHRKRRLTVAKVTKRPVVATTALSMTPAQSTFVVSSFPIRIVPPRSPTTPESICSTKVASPAPSQRTAASKRKPPMSAIVAATLSKKRPEWSLFKADSSIFVDVKSDMDEPLTPIIHHPSPVKPRRDLRAFLLRRTASIFGDVDEVSSRLGDDNLV